MDPKVRLARSPIRLLVPVVAFLIAATAAADRSQTVSGSVASIDAAHQTLVVKVGTEEMKFAWNADTRINGVLVPSAKVTVRYTPGADGQNLAIQISVGR